MKGRFLTECVLVHLSDKLKRLGYPLEFDSEILGRVIIAPAGFETDLASVPRLPFAYLLFGGVGDPAAVMHDWAYSGRAGLTREQADALFREALAALDEQSLAGKSGAVKAIPGAWFSVRRGAMWLGVRLFGGSHYTAAALAGVKQDPVGELERETELE